MIFYICKVIKKSVTLVFIWWFVQRTESRLEIKCTIIIIEINGGFKMPSDPSELTVITKAKDLASYVLTVTEKSPKGGRGLYSEKYTLEDWDYRAGAGRNSWDSGGSYPWSACKWLRPFDLQWSYKPWNMYPSRKGDDLQPRDLSKWSQTGGIRKVQSWIRNKKSGHC